MVPGSHGQQPIANFSRHPSSLLGDAFRQLFSRTEEKYPPLPERANDLLLNHPGSIRFITRALTARGFQGKLPGLVLAYPSIERLLFHLKMWDQVNRNIPTFGMNPINDYEKQSIECQVFSGESLSAACVWH